MRSVLTALVLALACACQSTPTVAPPAPFTLVDLSDDFTRFYDRSREMPAETRASAFRAEMAELFPGFYDPARFDGVSPQHYDQRLAQAIEAFPAIREAYTDTATSFEETLAPARASFVESFPDLAPMGDIYLLHSLGEMDGGTRMIDGRLRLIFGADVMARIHEPGRAQPFFHHELFHIYHYQYFPGCDLTWCDLWQEGLATWVAHQLNPQASDKQLLLEFPRPLRPEVDAELSTAVCAVRANFDRAAPRGFFTGGRAPGIGALPPRFAYYVGYLAAREAARERSTRDLALLNNQAARPVVEAALGALSACPAAN